MVTAAESCEGHSAPTRMVAVELSLRGAVVAEVDSLQPAISGCITASPVAGGLAAISYSMADGADQKDPGPRPKHGDV